MTGEPCPTCLGTRAPSQAMCRACWKLVPRQLRERYWKTRPGSVARSKAYLDVVGCIIGPASRERRRAPHMSA